LLPPGRSPTSKTERPRLPGMPGDGRYLGPSAGVPQLWSYRLLRFLEKQTRHETLPRDQTSHRAILRTRRRLALVLCGRSVSRVKADLRPLPSAPWLVLSTPSPALQPRFAECLDQDPRAEIRRPTSGACPQLPRSSFAKPRSELGFR